MREAKLHQRSINVTLLDLRNAFGEVSHNLITSLRYHHLPENFIKIISCIYHDSRGVTTAPADPAMQGGPERVGGPKGPKGKRKEKRKERKKKKKKEKKREKRRQTAQNNY